MDLYYFYYGIIRKRARAHGGEREISVNKRWSLLCKVWHLHVCRRYQGTKVLNKCRVGPRANSVVVWYLVRLGTLLTMVVLETK